MIAGLVAGYLFLRAGALPYIIAIITFAVHFGFWLCYMYYARKYCQVRLRSYFHEVVVPVVLVTVACVLLPLGLSFVNIGKWMVLLICLADLIWVGAAVYVCGLEKVEKQYVLSYVKKLYNKLSYGKSDSYTPRFPRSS